MISIPDMYHNIAVVLLAVSVHSLVVGLSPYKGCYETYTHYTVLWYL